MRSVKRQTVTADLSCLISRRMGGWPRKEDDLSEEGRLTLDIIYGSESSMNVYYYSLDV